MIKGSQDKMQREAETKAIQSFFFPTYGISIEATTREEADIKLQAYLKTNNENNE